MIVLLRCPAPQLRRWTGRLAARLAALPGVAVELDPSGAAAGTGRSTALLIELERLLLRRLRPGAADPMTPADLALPPAGSTAEVVIDLAADALEGAAQPGTLRLAVLYDGVAGEEALLAAVLSGRLPIVEVVDVATGDVLGRANPSPETAGGLSGGIDAVSARLVTLLEKLVGLHRQGRRPTPLPSLAPRSFAPRSPYAFEARLLAASAIREIYRLCCHAPHWRVGWRMNDGDGVMERGDLSGPRWNVLPDPGHRFYADPVPVTWQGRSVLFVEDLDHHVGKGIISAIEIGPDGPVGAMRPVLEDPWHLSFPFLIAHGGALYMIPETGGNRDVALYRCVSFPDRWERCAVLLSGLVAADVTIIPHEGRMWMFAATYDDGGGWSDCLSIWHAPDLFGPWTPLAENPVLIDRDSARPAGNMVIRDGRLWRPVQDCSGGYGSALGLAEVTRLDPEGFAQEVRHIVRPGPRWPGRKLHTLNRAGRLEVIDGTTIRPKLPALAKLVDARREPGA
ncbi:glucosamine inositolphosphorylceramide transferase family protein [Methylobrevis pamukkalensis]|uniref:Glucosamine inositolphosphorylceramide transferase 1 N-terminal domain-containing protein n=1 Tax=Methylobrevis pamukkalensis TaxID=1439726 RepID=A0A1E3H4Y9_9HYPH|nr:hypothetical protein [Methylobrevis pamukkalensis]ODN71384.1 hypothetical protein A6302_01248 [Methylobrevis pamukkalensis]